MSVYADLWRDVYDTARRRPRTWCLGCGYTPPAAGRHSDSCTNPAVRAERRRAIIAQRLAEIDQWRKENP
jgi:hypothetical protein